MDTYQWWWHGMGFMWLIPLLVMVLMMVFVCRGGWRMGCGPGHREERETPRDVLDRRLANGEITQERYEEIKRLLGA